MPWHSGVTPPGVMGATMAAARGTERDRPPDRTAVVRPHDRAATTPQARILDLQRSVGNAAVAQLLVQRRKAALPNPKPALRKKPAKEHLNSYIAFCDGLDYLTENWKAPKGVVVDADLDGYLSERHRTILRELHGAHRQRSLDGQAALGSWQMVQPKLLREVDDTRRFPQFTDQARQIPRDQISYLNDKIFLPSAYRSARQEKKSEGHLKAPDRAAMTDKLKKAEDAFWEVNKLYADTAKLGAEAGVFGKGLGKTVPDLYEILQTPGDLDAKLTAARKKLGIQTASELVQKVLSGSKTLIETAGKIGEAYCLKMANVIGTAANASKIAKYKALAGKFQALGKSVERIGSAAAILSIAINYGKLVEAIWTRNLDDALAAAGDLALDVGALALGAEAAGPLAAGVIVVKGVLESVRLAAGFIRWCRDETVRVAAQNFVDKAVDIANNSAFDLVADAEIVLDPSKEAVHDIAGRQLIAGGKRVAHDLSVLNRMVMSGSKRDIGGHAAVKLALGKKALDALFLPQEDSLVAAQQVKDVFEGVDAMARYVKGAYTN